MNRILVIDDDDALRELTLRLLTSAGYSAVGANDGLDGLRMLAEERFELAITDIMMPRMEGLELIIECRNLHPGLKIIAVSGAHTLGKFDALPAAEGLGAIETLDKPFSKDELLRAVERCIGKPEAA
jgi:DNA-binding NtrC family response regulator